MSPDTFTSEAAAVLPVANLIRVDHALESMRNAGFDLPTAVGECVDNSQQAKASIIRIRTIEATAHGATNGKARPKEVKTINAIAFADDGVGISKDVLANTLTLGFSSRYNQRDGLGRFGVGMKLAAISQGRRIEIFTRPLGEDRIYHAYLDLDLIASGEQQNIVATEVADFPEEYRDLMFDAKGRHFSSGSLVIWSKIDRLSEGGKYGASLEEKKQELIRFLARAYRNFIDKGLHIELNGRVVTLHDPTFRLLNPRVLDYFPDDPRAKVIEEVTFDIDDHEVHAVVTLYPEEVRHTSGQGGLQYKDLYIADNERKVSILRNGREIYYDVVPKLLPSRTEGIALEADRYIGIEISFPAALDEYFQVRHVKRGAEPVAKLRGNLNKFLKRPVEAARREIKETWEKTAQSKRDIATEHESAHESVKRAEVTSPGGKGGFDVGPEQEEQLLNELFDDLHIDPIQQPGRAEEIMKQVRELPITIIDTNWPGNELVDIVHLNGRAIVKINHRHPFIREIYDPVKMLANGDAASIDTGEVIRLARKAEAALDVLFMAYAKAENMHPNPEDAYSELRTDWGKFSASYVRGLRSE